MEVVIPRSFSMLSISQVMVALAFWANQFVPDLRESWTPSSRVAWRESLCDETSGRRQVWSRVGKFQTLLYGETSMPDGENHSCPRYLLRMFEEGTWWKSNNMNCSGTTCAYSNTQDKIIRIIYWRSAQSHHYITERAIDKETTLLPTGFHLRA